MTEKWEQTVIWKYILSPFGETALTIPHGGKIRYFAVQNDNPCLWIEFLESDAEDEKNCVMRVFNVFMTGQPIPIRKLKDYVGSFMLNNGSFVGHLYEMDKRNL